MKNLHFVIYSKYIWEYCKDNNCGFVKGGGKDAGGDKADWSQNQIATYCKKFDSNGRWEFLKRICAISSVDACL